jgi:hypothetical protein
MGHGLSKTHERLVIVPLVLAAPGTYTAFLGSLEYFAAQTLAWDATTFGNMLKAYGCPIFVAGHAAICLRKPALELPDVCYMSACSALSVAFAGAYCKKPVPEAVLSSALLFFGAYLPLRWRLLAAKTSPLVPTLGVCAAAALVWVGICQLSVKYGLMEKPPKKPMTMVQTGTLAGTLLGIANCIKLQQLVQQKAPKDNVLLGQVLKVIASFLCFTGNTLLLGWQRKAIPGFSIWHLQTAIGVARLLKLTRNESVKKCSSLDSLGARREKPARRRSILWYLA